jgi:hypothetical protein
MWPHVFELELKAGKSPHEATVAAQAAMHRVSKSAPTSVSAPPHDQPEWLRRSWEKAE